MRMAYVCLQPRTGTGASDTHVDGLVNGLRQLGVEVDLFELRISSPSLLVRLLAGLALQIRALRVLRSTDVVYVRMHPTAALLPWMVGSTPLLVEVNGVPEDYVAAHPRLVPLASLVRCGIRRLLARAHHVMVVTPGLGQRVREWVPSARILVVPNAADPQRFRPDLQPPLDAPEERYAIFFGTLTPWQGLDLAVAAAMRHEWPDDLRLLIVGDGAERDLAKHAAAEAPTRITFLGPRSNEELPAYVANAEISLCLKQYHDPVAGQSPLKLYESLAAGVPVIATELHGATDVAAAEGAVSIVCPVASAIASKVEELHADPARRSSLALMGRNVIMTGNTWHHRAESIYDLLTTNTV